MRFSQRIGKSPVKTGIQLRSMDDDLRTSLWNAFRLFFLDRVTKRLIYNDSDFHFFFKMLWADFFKRPLDTLPDKTLEIDAELKKWFFEKADWSQVYDFIEFIATTDSAPSDDVEMFKIFCNSMMQRELAGYRFVGDHITPISNETELTEIEEVLENAAQNRLSGVQEHINDALLKMSNRKLPDYRNSIKESISAVESIAKVISGDAKADLTKALKVIKTKIDLHPALELGFLKIYGYTSDEGGIRHALMEQSTCDFEDAKFMLVSCSAFINYLIMKGEKAKLF